MFAFRDPFISLLRINDSRLISLSRCFLFRSLDYQNP